MNKYERRRFKECLRVTMMTIVILASLKFIMIG
jgi:hypothetical protein